MKTIYAGDHTILKCSNCDRELVDILHLDPEAPVELKVKATCPCGDYSYPVTIQGRFQHSPKFEYVNETEKADLFIDEMITNEDEVVFIVKEVK